SRFSDLFGVLAQRIARGKPLLNGLAVADDDTQQIVEIVCDSPGETPYSFHFLRLPELILAPPQEFFGLLALGNIAADDDDLLDFPPEIAHRAAGRLKGAPFAIFQTEPVFHARSHARFKCFLSRRNQGHTILGVDLLRNGASFKIFPGVSELDVSGTVVMPLAIAVHHGDK